MASKDSELQLAVQCVRQEPGDAAACLRVAHIPLPNPKDDEAFVKMLLRPINPADLRSLQGLFAGLSPESLPAVPGIEGVGRIAQPCSKFAIGQRVVSTAWPLKSGQVTAVGLLKESAVPKGEWLMLTAAGSSIGRQIIQIGHSYGMKIIAIVRQYADQQELLRLGADVVLSTVEDNLTEAVADVTNGKGAYACLDAVGGLAGPTLTAGIKDIVYSSQVIRGFRMTPWFMSHDKAGQEAIVKEVFRLLQHVIEPYHGQTFPLQNAAEAIKTAQQTQRKAKILLSSLT